MVLIISTCNFGHSCRAALRGAVQLALQVYGQGLAGDGPAWHFFAAKLSHFSHAPPIPGIIVLEHEHNLRA